MANSYFSGKQEDNVSAKHPKYDHLAMLRNKYYDIISGAYQLKLDYKKYLPIFPSESSSSHLFRVETLTHFNLLKKTRDVMTGLVFKSEIELHTDVAPEIVPLIENIDNAGTHLDVFARKALESSFAGYSLILTDAPPTVVTSLEEQLRFNLRPYFKLYDADAIWNWSFRTNATSNADELCLLVLRECKMELSGHFLYKEVVRYRVYRLMGNMVTLEVFMEEKDEKTGKMIYIRESFATLPFLTQIPAAFVGELGCHSPLQDIADKNLEHTQTYSDYKSIIHKTCVPMLYLLGSTKDDAATATVSGDLAWALPDSGEVGFAEVEGKGIEATRKTLLDIREDIALMGLSLLADQSKMRTDVTATEVLLNNIGETAELRVIARSLNDALELSFGHLAEFLGLQRDAGGSLTLGSAWNSTVIEVESIVLPNGMTISEFNVRLDLANKAKGLLPQETIMTFLMGDEVSESEITEMISELEEEQEVDEAPVM